MSQRFTVGLVQITAEREHAPSIARAMPLVRDAAKAGADLIALPENATMIEPASDAALAKALPEQEHPGLAAYRAAAQDLRKWILIGSLSVRSTPAKYANRSFLIDPSGAVAARYDKIHLFDVDLPNGERYRESDRVTPGAAAVTADLPWARLGMTVCYDVRFAQLYRALAQAGATVIAVPAAFTALTGEAHWHTLLRARAIETGSFIIAPAQTGTHAEGRRTFGHSLAVGPWGDVLADGGTDEGFVLAAIDPAAAAAARARIPALAHDRPFAPPAIPRRAAE
ncbi:MAG: carbon-nitrogen hydrolase family protein [Alphaproteobacteria bacterium]